MTISVLLCTVDKFPPEYRYSYMYIHVLVSREKNYWCVPITWERFPLSPLSDALIYTYNIHVSVSHEKTHFCVPIHLRKASAPISIVIPFCIHTHTRISITRKSAIDWTSKEAFWNSFVVAAVAAVACCYRWSPVVTRTATHCNILQCTAMHCNALQYLKLVRCCSCGVFALQHTATYCNTLQHTYGIMYCMYCL